MENIDWLKYENEAFDNGFECVCGVDEAGRGPLAGPVCAAAVILPRGCIIDGLNDSKKLSEKKREQLFDVITEKAEAYSIAMASEKEIDEINILQATFLAMRRAVGSLEIKPDFVIVDGNRDPLLGIKTMTLVKGDSLCESVAAASVLAKTWRDEKMRQLAKEYPEYGWDRNMGYPTKEHIEAIKKFGLTPWHRRSFHPKELEPTLFTGL